MENKLTCSIEGCATEFVTSGPISPNARFICKNHTRKEQVVAVGRNYKPVKDEADSRLKLQIFQHDLEMEKFSGPSEWDLPDQIEYIQDHLD